MAKTNGKRSLTYADACQKLFSSKYGFALEACQALFRRGMPAKACRDFYFADPTDMKARETK